MRTPAFEIRSAVIGLLHIDALDAPASPAQGIPPSLATLLSSLFAPSGLNVRLDANPAPCGRWAPCRRNDFELHDDRRTSRAAAAGRAARKACRRHTGRRPSRHSRLREERSWSVVYLSVSGASSRRTGRFQSAGPGLNGARVSPEGARTLSGVDTPDLRRWRRALSTSSTALFSGCRRRKRAQQIVQLIPAGKLDQAGLNRLMDASAIPTPWKRCGIPNRVTAAARPRKTAMPGRRTQPRQGRERACRARRSSRTE